MVDVVSTYLYFPFMGIADDVRCKYVDRLPGG